MLDPRPVLHVIGLMLLVLAALMLIPGAVDFVAGNENGGSFGAAALITAAAGGMLALTTATKTRHFDSRSAYLLTTLAWILLPAFGALPFLLGAPGLGVTDAYFEAVSGITTTGSTVILGLDHLPPGMNLWRGMLNSMGGLGIAFVAMIFLPVMRVGGMQFFKVQGYDTMGKILPRASDIALSLLGVYAALTVACITTYAALGMTPLDAIVMGMASIATGGFAPTDASIGKYPGGPEYAASLFMFLGALPYIRYVQLVTGHARPLWTDPQVRALVLWLLLAVLAVTVWRLMTVGGAWEPAFRTALMNLISIMTSTGFSSGGFAAWGGFALLTAFALGLVGGCSGSSAAALSVFRVQLIFAALAAQLRQIAAPHRVAPVKYDGRRVDAETLDALIMFSVSYILLLGLLSIALTLLGVDMNSALLGVWAALSNIGYGMGPVVEPTGTFMDFPDGAKWVLILAMLLGRMALLAAFVILMPRFWRA